METTFAYSLTLSLVSHYVSKTNPLSCQMPSGQLTLYLFIPPDLCGYVSISRPLSFCWWWLKPHLGNLSGTLKGQLESNIYLEFLSLDSRPLRTDFFFPAKLSQLYFLASIPTPLTFFLSFFQKCILFSSGKELKSSNWTLPISTRNLPL